MSIKFDNIFKPIKTRPTSTSTVTIPNTYTTTSAKPTDCTTTTVAPTTIATTTTSRTTAGCDPEPADDGVITLFKHGPKLSTLTLDQKVSAVVALTSTPHGQQTTVVIINLFRMMAYTQSLFGAVPQPALNEALAIVTSDACPRDAVSADVRQLFVTGVLSMSPGALYRVSRPVLVALLAMVSPDEHAAPLPRAAAETLVTTLSLYDGRLIDSLPPATLRAAWSAVARQPADLLARLPPSTTAAFLGAVLRAAVAGQSQSPRDRMPSRLIAAVLGPAMTSRLLGVLPVGHVDLLLVVVGRCPELLAELSSSGLVSMLKTLTAGPALLTAVDQDHLERALIAVSNNYSVTSVPENVIEQLFDAIRLYIGPCRLTDLDD